MIYLIYGSDFKKSREKLHSLVEGLFKKEPKTSIFNIDSENFKEETVSEFISGQTLFSVKYIVVLDNILGDKDSKEFVLANMKKLKESENLFIFLDGEINKTTLARFKKWAEKTQEFASKAGKKNDFNVFTLTDALGSRDRKNLWVLYQKALNANLSPEEIQGVLSWQVRNLVMIKESSNPEKLGLNPYVLRKSLGFVSNFSSEELIKISEELVNIPHNSRRGIGEMGVSLERFILSV